MTDQSMGQAESYDFGTSSSCEANHQIAHQTKQLISQRIKGIWKQTTGRNGSINSGNIAVNEANV